MTCTKLTNFLKIKYREEITIKGEKNLKSVLFISQELTQRANKTRYSNSISIVINAG